MLRKANMRRSLEKPKRVFMALFSFWFLIFPAFLYYCTLDASDLVSPCLSLQDLDQEYSIPDAEKQPKVLHPSLSLGDILIIYLSPVRLPKLSNALLPCASTSVILRC